METYAVYYPSGRNFMVTGRLDKVRVPNCGLSPVVYQGAKKALMLDPRAVVMRLGKVVYEPMANALLLDREMRQWLAENPQWPALLEV